MKGGVTLPSGLPGWEAFSVAANMALPSKGTDHVNWYFSVLAAMSALSTVLFVIASAWIIWRGSPGVRRISGWIAALFFVLNTHWFIFLGKDRFDLRAGYYLWLFSFLVLSIGLFASARESNPAPLAKSHTA
jgi:hypothetical protein